MDPLRFDHLTRLLSEARGRRAVLGTLLPSRVETARLDMTNTVPVSYRSETCSCRNLR